MRLYEINSRLIKAVGYETSSKKLVVHFTKGSVHCYTNVPAETYAAFMNADSIGRFYEKSIRSEYSYFRM
ncbi:MAG: KTSC domain-containing protein [Bacteroidota bacterium]